MVAVLIEWIDEGVDQPTRRVRGNNLYGYGRDGGLLWRVQGPERLERALLLTGFLEDTQGLRLHEAYGWWVDVDPGTGRVIQAQWVG